MVDDINILRTYNSKQLLNRQAEFQRLQDIVYLDHAGATLYAQSQLKNLTEYLSSTVLGNPHSRNGSSKLATELIENVRWRILKHFNTTAEKYTVIFTSGCTAALKLLGESFDYANSDDKTATGCYCYLEDNHTSVTGIRELAAARGVIVKAVSMSTSHDLLQQNGNCPASTSLSMFLVNGTTSNKNSGGGNSLFAYPAQSNFSGLRYPLHWIDKVHSGWLNDAGQHEACERWHVLLDAAAYVSTAPLDLDIHSPDFVSLSFYKMFGFPTGLGALIVKNSVGHLMKKTYFGGGSIQVSLAGERFHVFRSSLHERFEDGTVSFLDIVALKGGFDTLWNLGGSMKDISQYTFQLAKYTYDCLCAMKHANSHEVVRIYSKSGFRDNMLQGPIIALNILDSQGQVVGFSKVEKLAEVSNIHLRTGCFCNIGACQYYLGLSSEQIRHNFEAGHVCGDEVDLIDSQPTGCIRISFGYMSTISDADAFIKFVSDNLIERTVASSSSPLPASSDTPAAWIVTNIYVYPVKSAGALAVTSWPLGRRGLRYDRQWMVVTEAGVCVSQKRATHLCLLCPAIDEDAGILTLSYPGHASVTVPLKMGEGQVQSTTTLLCTSRICNDKVSGVDCGEEVAAWLQACLGISGVRLLRQLDDDERSVKPHLLRQGQGQGHGRAEPTAAAAAAGANLLSLANEAQLLVISRASCKHLVAAAGSGDASEDDTSMGLRFRPNLVLDGPGPEFAEDSWRQIIVNDNIILGVQGRCVRCQMICVDQATGSRSKAPLVTLMQSLKRNSFGLLLEYQSTDERTLSVGHNVTVC